MECSLTCHACGVWVLGQPQVMVSHLVDSNVFIRALVLSLQYFRSGAPTPPYLGPSTSSISPRPSSTIQETWAVAASKAFGHKSADSLMALFDGSPGGVAGAGGGAGRPLGSVDVKGKREVDSSFGAVSPLVSSGASSGGSSIGSGAVSGNGRGSSSSGSSSGSGIRDSGDTVMQARSSPGEASESVGASNSQGAMKPQQAAEGAPATASALEGAGAAAGGPASGVLWESLELLAECQLTEFMRCNSPRLLLDLMAVVRLGDINQVRHRLPAATSPPEAPASSCYLALATNC